MSPKEYLERLKNGETEIGFDEYLENFYLNFIDEYRRKERDEKKETKR